MNTRVPSSHPQYSIMALFHFYFTILSHIHTHIQYTPYIYTRTFSFSFFFFFLVVFSAYTLIFFSFLLLFSFPFFPFFFLFFSNPSYSLPHSTLTLSLTLTYSLSHTHTLIHTHIWQPVYPPWLDLDQTKSGFSWILIPFFSPLIINFRLNRCCTGLCICACACACVDYGSWMCLWMCRRMNFTEVWIV